MIHDCKECGYIGILRLNACKVCGTPIDSEEDMIRWENKRDEILSNPDVKDVYDNLKDEFDDIEQEIIKANRLTSLKS